MALSQEDFAKVRDLYHQIDKSAYINGRDDAVKVLRRYANDPGFKEHRALLVNLADVILSEVTPQRP